MVKKKVYILLCFLMFTVLFSCNPQQAIDSKTALEKILESSQEDLAKTVVDQDITKLSEKWKNVPGAEDYLETIYNFKKASELSLDDGIYSVAVEDYGYISQIYTHLYGRAISINLNIDPIERLTILAFIASAAELSYIHAYDAYQGSKTSYLMSYDVNITPSYNRAVGLWGTIKSRNLYKHLTQKEKAELSEQQLGAMELLSEKVVEHIEYLEKNTPLKN